MNIITAKKIKFNVTPARIKVNVGTAPLVRAMKNTRAIVRNAPMKAATEMMGIPNTTVSRPNQIATNAPKELPADTPSVNGSARESRNIASNSTPAVASAPPTREPNNARGSRATKKISRSGLAPASTLRQVTPVEPTHGATSSTIRQNRAHEPTTIKNRAADRPPLCCGNDVTAMAIGPLDDTGGDFKDVIKVLRR